MFESNLTMTSISENIKDRKKQLKEFKLLILKEKNDLKKKELLLAIDRYNDQIKTMTEKYMKLWELDHERRKKTRVQFDRKVKGRHFNKVMAFH